MLTPIDEEWGQFPPKSRCRIIDSEDSVGQPHVPVILPAVGKSSERVAQDSIDTFCLGIGVLVICGAHQKTGANAPRELSKQTAGEPLGLGS